MAIRDRYILFSNLQCVVVNGVRTYCRALLLERTESFFDRDKAQCKIRGFGPDAAWPVFDIFLKSDTLDYSTQEAASTHAMFIGSDDKARPLASGAILTIAGLSLELHSGNREQPIVRDEFDGDQADRIVLSVWDKLADRACDSWDAPYMPLLMHEPVAVVRAHQKQRRRM